MLNIIKSIICVLGMLAGLSFLVYGCFLLAKWLGFIVLGIVIYWLFEVMVGDIN